MLVMVLTIFAVLGFLLPLAAILLEDLQKFCDRVLTDLSHFFIVIFLLV